MVHLVQLMKHEPKTEKIVVRVEQKILGRATALAAAWSMTISGAIRRLIIEAKLPKEQK